MLFVSFIFGVFVGVLFREAWSEIKSIKFKKMSPEKTKDILNILNNLGN